MIPSQYLTLQERLNLVLPRITSPEFLQNKGLGNEIGFHIFDYPAEHEDLVRDFIQTAIEPALTRPPHALRYHKVDLFELIVGLLQERKLYDKVLEMQRGKGNNAALSGLRSVLKEDKLARYLADRIDIPSLDLMLLTGVGAAYPMVRVHTLLNGLHAVMQDTPLVVFYPGRYDGTALRLFGQSSERNDVNAPYYRAFQLLK